MSHTHQASDSWLQTSQTSTQYPLDSSRLHRRLSLPEEQPSAIPDPACTTSLQQPAPQTSRIVITTKYADPLCSFVKEVDVGNTVICYVPRNVVFNEPPNFFSTQKTIINSMCYQTDVNFSMALLCKPQQLPENCLTVWTVDDRIRRHAMWSSPEFLYSRNEEPKMSMKTPWFLGKSVMRERPDGRLSYPTSRGPVSVSGVYHPTKSGFKKYQGRVPSIVALLTSHAKSHHKLAQKSVRQHDVEFPMPKIFQTSHSGMEKEFWQQKRFTPVSQEIHKAMAREGKQWQYDPYSLRNQSREETVNPVLLKMDNINRGKKLGFSYHLDPPTGLYQMNRSSMLNLPPPPQMPLPPVPEIDDPAVPGPSTRRDSYPSRPGRPPVPWKDLPEPGRMSGRYYEMSKPVPYRAQRLSESVTFINPYTQRPDGEFSSVEDRASHSVLTPHSERQRRESTTLFFPEEVIKPHHLNTQKLSAVLVLSMFVVALLIFYLVYFI